MSLILLDVLRVVYITISAKEGAQRSDIVLYGCGPASESTSRSEFCASISRRSTLLANRAHLAKAFNHFLRKRCGAGDRIWVLALNTKFEEMRAGQVC